VVQYFTPSFKEFLLAELFIPDIECHMFLSY
jgi:hypothetical protein